MKPLKLQSLILFLGTLFCTSVLLSGCATTSTTQASLNPNDAMMMANLYQNKQKNVYLLQAAKIYLNQDNKTAASHALQQINTTQLNI